MTTDQLRNAFIERRLAALPDRIARVTDADQQRTAARRAVDANLAELERNDQYRARVVDVARRGSVLAAQRYLGLNRSQGFVEILELTDPVAEDTVEALAPALSEAFPLARDARFLVTDLRALGPTARADVVVVAAKLSDVQATSPAARSHVELRRCTTDSVVDRYEQLYQDEPGLADVSYPSSRSLLSEMIADGHLYEIFHDELGWVGVIGVRQRPVQGFHGWEIVDEAVVPDARRRGIAAAAQWNLAWRLAEEQRWLWGTVDASNEPSRRAAARVGREPVWTHGFVALRDSTPPPVRPTVTGSDHVDVDERYVESVDMSGWERVVHEFLQDCVFPRRLPPHGLIVELGTARGLNFDLLCRQYGPERCLGYDVVNYLGHPRIREVDVRRLGAADDVEVAFGWNDLSDWELSPESKRAGLDFLRRNLVAGGYYMDAGFTAAALDEFDETGLEPVATRGLIRLWRRV